MNPEREAYEAPAEPVVVGSMSQADITYGGSGTDFSFYSSVVPG